jgi:hypothetical protein
MHSRIFQVSTTPLDPSDFISPWGLPDSFTVEVADYVGEVEDRADSIQWLMESHSDVLSFDPSGEVFQLTKDSKERYFTVSYRKFRETVAMLRHKKPPRSGRQVSRRLGGRGGPLGGPGSS